MELNQSIANIECSTEEEKEENLNVNVNKYNSMSACRIHCLDTKCEWLFLKHTHMSHLSSLFISLFLFNDDGVLC